MVNWPPADIWVACDCVVDCSILSGVVWATTPFIWLGSDWVVSTDDEVAAMTAAGEPAAIFCTITFCWALLVAATDCAFSGPAF